MYSKREKETAGTAKRDTSFAVPRCNAECCGSTSGGIFHGECMAGEREGDDGTIWTGWDICRRTASDQSGGWNEPAN